MKQRRRKAQMGCAVRLMWRNMFGGVNGNGVSNEKKARDILHVRKISIPDNFTKAQIIEAAAMSAGMAIDDGLRAEFKAAMPKGRGKKKGAPAHSGKDFYSSKEWRSLRYKVIAKYGRKCMCCGWTPDHEEDQGPIHVDHIKPRSKRPDLSLDINNLQILCAWCNLGKGNTDDTDFRPIDEGEDSFWMDEIYSATIN